ncbi:MAG: TetR/AcrR family transcriptional regulator [Deltaproteobacteria bacterium]|nr:TetR/AcrR family transcriptional regulator [Deltaproteobacteria bacterium]
MARPRSDISQRLVKAARAHFLAHGVDGASLREIAKDARTSVGMVSYYFPTKDALFLAVVEEVYGKLMLEASERLGGDGPLDARLQQMLVRIHRMSDDEFAVVRIILREAMVSSKRLRKLVARFTREQAHIPLLIDALGSEVIAGRARDDLPLPMLMIASLAISMGPVMLRRLASNAGYGALLPEPEVAAATQVKVLFEGIGTRRKKK